MKRAGRASASLARDLWHTLHMKVAMRLWPERIWRKVKRGTDQSR